MFETNPLTRETFRHLVWPIRLTRTGMVAEQITRGFWPVWTILFAVMAALAFGLHETLPLEVFWGVGLAATGGLIWALVRGFGSFAGPRAKRRWRD